MKRARFLITFFIWLAAFEGLLVFGPFERGVVQPFTRGIAVTSGGILRAAGLPNRVVGTVIAGSCFSVDIENGCNGVEATMFLVAAILAFPATARLRAIGAVLGSVIIQAMNLLRVLTLYLAGCYRREWFETLHLAVWQTIIFAAVTLYFLAWTKQGAPERV